MSESFESLVRSRSAAVYADFLLPHLAEGFRVLDVGCGRGSITLGLAAKAPNAHVVGVDPEADFASARRYAARHGIENVEFHAGDVYVLDFPDGSFDACLCHSMLETLERPLDGLLEIMRVMKPGGVLGVACVEYGGLILAGPKVELLRRFYAVRERLWQLDGHADPYRGRQLRSLLARAGFDAIAHGLAAADDIDDMREAWLAWSGSPDAYAAFAWCRALGRKPV